MTRQSTKQHGISLVEVVLTLAISSLLIATVLSGRNSIRSQAQFSDGVERIKETILSVKSEANTSNNKLGKGTSTSSGEPPAPGSTVYILLGQSLLFDTNTATTMQSANVLCYGAPDLSCGTKLTSSLGSQQNLATPWGIKYLGYTTGGATVPVRGKLNLVFAREAQTGSFIGSWYPADTISRDDLRRTVFDNQSAITLHFESTDRRKAIIVVNPPTGTVTRTIQ